MANFLDGQHGAVLCRFVGDGAGLDAREGLVSLLGLGLDISAGHSVGLALLHQHVVAGLDGNLLGLINIDSPALLPLVRHSLALLDIPWRGRDGDLNRNLGIKRGKMCSKKCIYSLEWELAGKLSPLLSRIVWSSWCTFGHFAVYRLRTCQGRGRVHLRRVSPAVISAGW